MPGLPLRWEGIDRWIRTPAPTLGQHNTEILTELGMSAEEIANLEESGVIGTWPVGA
jgi:crotonobetainyl-CoA:carnitine CoA-transferase CaiB-like acyl-CoA transferase